MPEISVIVPVYKVEPYLRRCVDSILAQTFTDFELILVDDGSPDNCGEICDEYAQKDNRIYVIHQNNGGLSVARNTGIDWVFVNSNSKWITFIDSDDWVVPQFLEALINAANEHQALISMCWLFHTKGDNPKIEADSIRSVLRSNVDAYSRNGQEIAAYAQGRLYAIELFLNTRFPIGRLFEDVFTTHRVCFSQQYIAVIEQGLYCYYENPTGIVQSKMTLRKAKDKFDAYEDQIEFFFSEGYDKLGKMQVRRYLNDILCLIAEMKMNARDNSEVLEILNKKKREKFIDYANRLDVNEESDAWILTKAFPVRMHIYWYWRALCNKVKRLVLR